MLNLKRFSFAIIVYFLGLSLLGLYFIKELPISSIPNRPQHRIIVSYRLNGQSPHTIEHAITAPLEGLLNRISGIKSIESVSDYGSGQIILYLDENINIENIRFEVSTQIRQIWPQLPQGTSYPQITQHTIQAQKENAFFHLYAYTDNLQNNLIKWIENILCPCISEIQGIEDIQISGQENIGTVITYNTEILRKNEINIENIVSAIQMCNDYSVVGNIIDHNLKSNTIYIDKRIEDINEILVTSRNGVVYPIRELVKIETKKIPSNSYIRVNGKNVIKITISTHKKKNQILIGNKIKEKISKLKASTPSGIHFMVGKDSSADISQSLTDVFLRSATSVLILLFFVYFTSKNARHICVVILSIMANICIAFICYRLFAVEIHLYSIIGVAISFGMMIDNIIVMADHLLYHGKLKVFLSLLASTLTTIASLVLVFFLNDFSHKGGLDFTLIIIINLSVSLFVGLLLTPSLMFVFRIEYPVRCTKRKDSPIVIFDKLYTQYIIFGRKNRKKIFLLWSLLFGWPIFLIPNHIEGNEKTTECINKILSSPTRLWLNRILGGSLYYFVHRNTDNKGGTFNNDKHTINAIATFSQNSSIEEVDSAMKRLENVLMKFPGNYTSEVHVNTSNGILFLHFNTIEDWNLNATSIKEALIKEAIQIGNATWNISGIGKTFDNNIDSPLQLFTITFSGYNYDQMIKYVYEWKKHLTEKYVRIRDISIHSENHPSDISEEYFFRVHEDKKNDTRHIFQFLKEQSFTKSPITIKHNNLPVVLVPEKKTFSDYWNINNKMVNIGQKEEKIKRLVSIEVEQTPKKIKKRNQSYTVMMSFNYLGDYSRAYDNIQKEIKEYSKKLPDGFHLYNSEQHHIHWKNNSLPWDILFIVIGVIYIICAILFNSLTYPLIVILSIPLSYIGIFLGYGLFKLPLGEGGLASFILLSGLTCNSVIYVLSDYISFKKKKPFLHAYKKAYLSKFAPIMITAISTIMGFAPFILDTGIQTFWFSLSIGIVFGLLFSVPITFLVLPLYFPKS